MTVSRVPISRAPSSLLAAVESHLESSGAALVVHGAAGAGQHDLAAAMRSRKSSPETLVVEGVCDAGASGPYRPFAQILGRLSQIVSPELGVALDGVLAASSRPDQGPSSLQALMQRVRVRDQRRNHMETIRKAFAELAQSQDLVLVVHDLHRADPDTLALVDYLIEDGRASGIVGIGTGPRKHPSLILTLEDDTAPGRALLSRLSQHENLRAIAVGRLDAQGVSALIAEPAIAEKLLTITGGLPHRIRTLFEVLPADLDGLVAARLSELAPPGRQALFLASTFGEPLAPGALAVLAAVSPLDVQRLRRDGFLSDDLSAPPRVRVADAWAMGVEAALVRSGLEVTLNGRCADFLQGRLAAGADPALHEAITRHLVAARRAAEAVEHALEASRWLARHAALSRAIALLESVRQHAADPRLDRRLVVLEIGLGRFEQAVERCDRMAGSDLQVLAQRARIYSLEGDLEAADAALTTLRAAPLSDALRDVADALHADVLLRRGRLDDASALAETRLSGAIPFADPVAHAELQHVLGKIAFWRADWAGAEGHYASAVALLPGPSEAAARARALVTHNLGLVSLRGGRYDEAAHRILEARDLLVGLGEHFEAAVCGHNLGLAYEYAQRYGLAAQMFEASIEVLERFGNRHNLAGAVNSLGDLYLTLGEHWRARKLLEHSLRLSQESGLDYFVAFNELRLSQVALAEAQLDEAAQRSAAAQQAFETLGHTEELAEAHWVRAQWAIRAGQLATARQHLKVAASDLASDEVKARVEVCRAQLELRRAPARAHSRAMQAADSLGRLRQRDGVVRALTVAAMAARKGGQAAEAEARLLQARQALSELRERVPAAHREAFDGLDFVVALAAAEERAEAGGEVHPAETPADAIAARYGIVGRSEALRRVLGMVERLADCDAPILILGESGTGKERIAEAICQASSRSDRPFIRVNAAAFADTLLESELFGHEKGAFTGAVSRKQGAFEQAASGTLFLDEIGDISPKTQISLLRVLQEREIRRVGGRKPIKVDVRILCATNRNLERMVADGSFRLDLYYRVKGLTLELPPLRDRGDDIVLLARSILRSLTEKHGRGVSLRDDAMALLRRYDWPGNVRELENVLRSVYFFASGDGISVDDLMTYTLLKSADLGPRAAGHDGPALVPDAPLQDGFSLNEAKRKLEIRCIQKALEQTDGNITRAAGLLGMKRPRLSQKIKELGLRPGRKELR